MSIPTVSVLIPAYNAEHYLVESVSSILNQTYQDFEILICDDCSTDNTFTVAQSLAAQTDCIKILQNSTNLNIAATRNRLLSEARGKYVAWQDADDISAPYRLAKQVSFLEKNQKVGIVGGYLQLFSNKKKLGIRKYASFDLALRSSMFFYSPVAQPTAMIRMECFKKVGLYGEQLSPAEDIDMSFRIGTQYLFANLPVITLLYRVHDSSATFMKLSKIELVTVTVRSKHMFHAAYRSSLSLFAIIFNVLQLVGIFLIPPKIKIWIFNTLRDNSI